MQKRTILTALFLLIDATISSHAAVFSSINIKDKLKTNELVLKMKVEGNMSYARINNIPVDATNGEILCGLMLEPGKNFARIEK